MRFPQAEELLAEAIRGLERPEIVHAAIGDAPRDLGFGSGGWLTFTIDSRNYTRGQWQVAIVAAAYAATARARGLRPEIEGTTVFVQTPGRPPERASEGILGLWQQIQIRPLPDPDLRKVAAEAAESVGMSLQSVVIDHPLGCPAVELVATGAPDSRERRYHAWHSIVRRFQPLGGAPALADGIYVEMLDPVGRPLAYFGYSVRLCATFAAG